jgi:hypothetical protein
MFHIIRSQARHLIYIMQLIFPKLHIDGFVPLRVSKPQLLCKLWSHEGVHCLFLKSWDISTFHLSLQAQKILALA